MGKPFNRDTLEFRLLDAYVNFDFTDDVEVTWRTRLCNLGFRDPEQLEDLGQFIEVQLGASASPDRWRALATVAGALGLIRRALKDAEEKLVTEAV